MHPAIFLLSALRDWTGKVMRFAKLLVFAVLPALAGCGGYAVYNGGLEEQSAATLQSASELRPSEAAVAFSTDYAPPQKNSTYAGPTNRVVTEVPGRTGERHFLTLKDSTATQRFSMASPPRLHAAGGQLLGKTDSIPSQSLAGPDGAARFDEQIGNLRVGNTGGFSSETLALGGETAVDRDALRLSADSEAAHTAQGSKGGLGIGDSDAAVEPAQASQPLKAGTVASAASYRKDTSAGIRTSADVPATRIDAVVPKGHLESLSPRDIAVPEQTLGVGERLAPDLYRTDNAPSGRADSTAPRLYTGPAAAKLLAERYVFKDIGNAQLLVMAGNSEGALVYTRFAAATEVLAGEALEHDTAAAGLAGRFNTKSTDSISEAEGASEVLENAGNLETRTMEVVSGGVSVHGLRTNHWSEAALDATAVSPPNLSVLKTARLIDASGIASLKQAGVLRDEPSSNAIICYRIHVFNASGSVASDVAVFDRLDAGTSLLVNSMSTNSDAAAARYHVPQAALEVTLPRLESGGYFVVEFYVELTQTP